MSTLSAVLFDIDGTLVDSNYAHVAAWSRAAEEVGHPADSWRIHRAIGMDSSLLLETVFGEDAERLGERASELHERYHLAAADRLRPFDGARELLRTLADRGLTVVLATSAPGPELEILRRILNLEDTIAVVTSADDVEDAKPAPDIMHAALRKAGVEADEAIMVGDAVWDVEAAGRAGIRCIGLLSGGTGALELREAGAVAVYEDCAGLLAGLAESPLA
jgi:HAD superfamily hydrolase (TIGR01509 family)